MSEGSVTRMSGISAATASMYLTPSCSTSPVRKTAQWFCMVCCMRSRIWAVGLPPLALRKKSKRVNEKSAEVGGSGL